MSTAKVRIKNPTTILTAPNHHGVHPPVKSRWVKGQSGNPGGKPTGARTRLQGAFLYALAEDFEEHGKKAIQNCRTDDPAAYLRVVASLMPKEIELTRPFDDLTDEQLDAACEALRAIAVAADRGAGTPASPNAQQAQGLSPVPQAS